MRIIEGLDNLNELDKKSIVTIGVFDGVHSGHQKIIKKVVNLAKKKKLYSVLITFDPYPREVLDPDFDSVRLTGTKLKLHLIENLGIDVAVVIKFNYSFAKMKAQDFIEKILVDKLNAEEIVLGKDFKFGAQAKGDIGVLKDEGEKYGFKVQEIQLFKTPDNEKISSTRIRQLIRQGELKLAKKILGHPVIISGKVVTGKGYGSITGFHTANVESKDKASVPKEGVYAGYALVDNKKLESAICIGPSPTFEIKRKRIEAHIIGYKRDLRDKDIEIEIVARIRGIVKFKNTESLSRQIKKDIEQTRNILSNN